MNYTAKHYSQGKLIQKRDMGVFLIKEPILLAPLLQDQ